MKKVIAFLSWLLISTCLLIFLLSEFAEASNLQADNLYKLIKSKRSKNRPQVELQMQSDHKDYDSAATPTYIEPQNGLMQADKIKWLPGQPANGVDFDQYSGYVTVDPKTGRSLFYYFAESPQNSSTNPLLLWLNGGPGCSSLGYGAMSELGPFRVNKDGKTLFRNSYSWNNVANVIFLESPAGVGFSYSNTSSDYKLNGDKLTAQDSYTFLVNWLERFPEYKTRDFYIAGESYAGHYVPQLAYTILLNNKNSNYHTIINLKGIAIGNAWIDDATSIMGLYEYLWTHALNSDQTHKGIFTHCDFVNEDNSTKECDSFLDKASDEIGDIDIYNIYAPICINPTFKNGSIGSVHNFDPCTDYYVEAYLNIREVQTALHAKPTNWTACAGFNWADGPTTVLPIIKNIMASDIRVWIYSGDVDGRVPITSTRYSINSLNLPIKIAWHPWYTNDEVGGYVEAYKGLTLVTVRGAGHLVPSYQPERALTLISSFLHEVLPPSKP